jgi:hypothetical protein
MGRAAILAGVDAAEWAGDVLFARNGVEVSAPALADLHDGGHYPDACALLTGWASYRTISATLTTTWTSAGGLGTMTASTRAEQLIRPTTRSP